MTWQGHERRFSIYLHANPGYVPPPDSSPLFRFRYIESEAVRGQREVATRLLGWHCLLTWCMPISDCHSPGPSVTWLGPCGLLPLTRGHWAHLEASGSHCSQADGPWSLNLCFCPLPLLLASLAFSFD